MSLLTNCHLVKSSVFFNAFNLTSQTCFFERSLPGVFRRTAPLSIAQFTRQSSYRIRTARVHFCTETSRRSNRKPIKALSGQPRAAMVAATSEADTDSTVASHRVGAVHRVPDLQITDHWIDVPLDYTGADQCTITVFAREVVAGSD
eukprot:jgi/Mesen1/2475/ME000158S01671